MRFAAMFATSPMDADAPLLAASRMFCSSLGVFTDTKLKNKFVKLFVKWEWEKNGLIYTPSRNLDILLIFEGTLLCLWVRQFGNSQGTRSSHHRGRYQRGRINLHNRTKSSFLWCHRTSYFVLSYSINIENIQMQLLLTDHYKYLKIKQQPALVTIGVLFWKITLNQIQSCFALGQLRQTYWC